MDEQNLRHSQFNERLGSIGWWYVEGMIDVISGREHWFNTRPKQKDSISSKALSAYELGWADASGLEPEATANC